jgi:hypothetical protein
MALKGGTYTRHLRARSLTTCCAATSSIVARTVTSRWVDAPGQVGLSAAVEADVAVGQPDGEVAVVVGAVVMVAAEQDGVVDVGLAEPAPGEPVVGLRPGAGDVAALGAAGPVAQEQGSLLGR